MLLETKDNVVLPTLEIVDYYESVRETAKKLNNVLSEDIPHSYLKTCAKELGLLKQGMIDVSRNGDVDVFWDYCIHQLRIENTHVVARYLLKFPPVSNTIEYSIFQSMLQSYYTVYEIKDIVRGKGVWVADLLYRREIFIIDIEMSYTVLTGVVLAGNIMPIDQFYMTTGANLIVPIELLESQLLAVAHSGLNERLPKNKEALLAAEIISAILKRGIWDSFGFNEFAYQSV